MHNGRHHSRTTPEATMALWQPGMLLIILVMIGLSPIRTAHAQEESPQLPRIAANTLVDDPDALRWNAVVLLARPTISSGDVDALPNSIRQTVSSFVLTILATVQASVDATSGETRYRLREVGVGYSVSLDGELKVVTADQAADMGVRLGFIQRRMLAENERQLGTARRVASTSTLMMFDTPAILQRGGAHQDYIMRHFVWVDARSGRHATLVWLLREDAAGGLLVVDEPLRWLPAGMKENRKIHVDEDKFLLGGIPTERAFALENLPPGKEILWTADARRVAALRHYDMQSLKDLTTALSAALQAIRTQR